MKKNIGIIGAGNMGEAFAGALVRSHTVAPERILIHDISGARIAALHDAYGVIPANDNQQVFLGSDIVVMAVKPQQLPEVLSSIMRHIVDQPAFQRRKMIISIAAGIRIQKLEDLVYAALPESACRNLPIIRVMPNTPALVLAGMSAMSGNRYATDDDLDLARTLLSSMGTTVAVREEEMDAVTALSGSGPAYVFYFVEALIEAGIALGFDPETATLLTTRTFTGALRLLTERQEPPADLRRKVTSPGGTTEAALKILTDNDVKQTIMQAVFAAAERSKELSR